MFSQRAPAIDGAAAAPTRAQRAAVVRNRAPHRYVTVVRAAANTGRDPPRRHAPEFTVNDNFLNRTRRKGGYLLTGLDWLEAA